ncbi:hypothetical protein [Hymenobacter metallicola]|uniref:Uncharacterized protein n=1 Tax=Hymenobacter metallicola TaxID=2563114 RepID=A0A4Z0Q1X1_9BACT|nr:hypothetical protein [Hymenobacter metallicola]TGE23101.1 hypothetical protein E5K02_22375 [Hymenobacter metallicola]
MKDMLLSAVLLVAGCCCLFILVKVAVAKARFVQALQKANSQMEANEQVADSCGVTSSLYELEVNFLRDEKVLILEAYRSTAAYDSLIESYHLLLVKWLICFAASGMVMMVALLAVVDLS